jgi:hypothetical protein
MPYPYLRRYTNVKSKTKEVRHETSLYRQDLGSGLIIIGRI